MKFTADTHVHFYDNYDLDTFINLSTKNLRGLDAFAKALFLCDRAGQDCLKKNFLTGKSKFTFSSCGDGSLVEAEAPTGNILLVPGRQIVTKERIELLGLGLTNELPDGEPLTESLLRVRDNGGAPVLCWSPGKWSLERGKLIQKTIDNSTPDMFLLGDISIRSGVFAEPPQFESARIKGFKILAGSDPLPFRGEERFVGTYCTQFEALDSERKSASGMAAALWKMSGISGRRNGVIQSVVRFAKSNLAKYL